MKLADWPENEKPREKLLRYGAKRLSEAELLSIILQTGIVGKNVLDLAREILADSGSLRNLVIIPSHIFLKRRGIGKAKYTFLMAALELGIRYAIEPIKIGTLISSTSLAKQFLSAKLKGYRHEIFACLFLDIHNRLIAYEELFQGTLSLTPVYPREVVHRALAYNAAKVIAAHNHPSGNPEPSLTDREITLVLKDSLLLIDVSLVDHIIVGCNTCVSLSEYGLL